MDEQTAKSLLSDIRNTEKNAFMEDFNPLANLNPLRSTEDRKFYRGVKEQASRSRATDRTNHIIQAILLAGGIGAGFRGLSGLNRMGKEIQPKPSKTVEMEVPIPAEEEEDATKTAEAEHTWLDRLADAVNMGPKSDPGATHNTGVGYYAPTMILGTALAGVGGWAGVDAIMDKQRKARSERKLEKAKENYEDAALDLHKESSDVAGQVNYSKKLDAAFEGFEKSAMLGLENLSGQAKGLLATYALLSGPASYMYVNEKMKKGSKRSIIEKAVKERARRAAKQQPFELYATPKPVEIPSEEEEDN